MASKNQKTAEQAASEQGAAAQPTPTAPAGEASQQLGDEAQQSEGEADPKAVLIEQLKADLQAVGAERDAYKEERDSAIGELDNALAAVPLFDDPYDALSEEGFATVLEIVLGIAHNRGIVTTDEEAEAAEADPTEEPSEAEYIKALLRRNGLQKAWMLPSGACFSEDHAREYAGAEFDSLTVVTLD